MQERACEEEVAGKGRKRARQVGSAVWLEYTIYTHEIVKDFF